MKGIYISVSGLIIVNFTQFFTVPLEYDFVSATRVLGFLLLLVGIVLSYIQSKTIEIPFEKSEFEDGKLTVPFKKFKKKLPIVDVFQEELDGLLERITIDVKHGPNNELVIGKSAQAFKGKLIIK